MSLTCVALMFLGRMPVEMKAISDMILGLTVSRFSWKKPAEKPSGHGALSGFIAKHVCLISSGVGIEISLSLTSKASSSLYAALRFLFISSMKPGLLWSLVIASSNLA
ncbi:unnamed protein product [Microthlaspi erraticum]|uniref:Uncharacterized protein n=1 Tax=Microthlaspi erraticum TaxID=1685480 RepID=A0A6D2HHB7_9BRAS|nr:unnamed protein product [Microthlaspi erraticum]